jgi:hypothetical protein
VKPALRDQRQRLARLVDGRRVRSSQQRYQVDPILRPRPVVTRQHLQCDEMTEASDRERQPGDDLDRLGEIDDLGLDPRRGEQQIGDGAAHVFPGKGETHGGQAPGGVLLDRRDDTPAACREIADECFGIPIIADQYCKVGIAREARLGSRGDGETTHERETTPEVAQVVGDAAKKGFGAAQRRSRGQLMGRPQASPCSAPGRVSSQATRPASSSASVASGRSRLNWAKRTDSPSAQRSSAVRSRAATASGASSSTPPL